MKVLRFTGALFLLSLLGAPVHAAMISLTPADCLAPNCWTTDDNTNLSIAEVEAIVGDSGLNLLYKQDQGAGSDTGSFAGSYDTSFLATPSDPSGAMISLVAGEDPINCGTCYLVVKDGNQSPAQYIFDLSLAGIIEKITLSDFWPAQGAISHVKILGEVSPIPVPAAFWLFGSALLGFVGMSRRIKV